jgi:type IV pilus assembly protein PilC
MFSAQLSLPDLIDLCRVLKHNLGAGLSILKVMKQQADRGRRSFRALATRISVAIQQGSSLSKALEQEKNSFPVLFLALVKLGETTGHMPEIFAELEQYYQLELQLKRQFRSQTMLPLIQFFGAVFIVAGVIFILGMIDPQKPLLTIFGLGGGAGALAFLGIVFGTLASLYSVYFVVSRLGRQKAWMDRIVLAIPALGPCLRAVLMSRFTIAMHLTLDSGLSIGKALRLSLEATGNAYFASGADGVVQALKNGRPLHEALQASGLFTDDFLEMILTSEESGRVPEMMKHQSQYYHEEASRKMRTLTMVASGGVWFCVAAFVVAMIFKIFGVYLGILENGAMGKF